VDYGRGGAGTAPDYLDERAIEKSTARGRDADGARQIHQAANVATPTALSTPTGLSTDWKNSNLAHTHWNFSNLTDLPHPRIPLGTSSASVTIFAEQALTIETCNRALAGWMMSPFPDRSGGIQQ
jgi:hypothetical protein